MIFNTKSNIKFVQEFGLPLLSTIFINIIKYKISHRERNFNKKLSNMLILRGSKEYLLVFVFKLITLQQEHNIEEFIEASSSASSSR